MNRQRLVFLLVAALLVISAAFYVATRRDRTEPAPGMALFPGMAAGLNAVSAVTVRKGGSTAVATIHKTGAQWTVLERGDYPADIAKLRKLLSAMGDAKIIEEKTSDPTRYAAIGVEDLAQAGASGVEITVRLPAGTDAVLVGKAVADGSFVRRIGEHTSYSVEPALAAETEPRFWIDSRLLDVPTTLILSVDLKPAAGAPYVLHRTANADPFTLDGVPAGRTALDPKAFAPGPTLVAGLTAEDVAPAADIDFKQPSQAVITLSDGNVLTLTGTVIADKHWLEVHASKDDTLAAKTAGRAFLVASYRYDAIFKPLEQLLAAKPVAGVAQGATRPGTAAPAHASMSSRKPAQSSPAP